VFVVEGEAAVREYARHRPKAMVELLATPAAMETARAVQREAQSRGTTVPVRERERDPADMCGKQSPLAARVKLVCLPQSDFEQRLESRERQAETRDLILALDHVQDPRNVGAVVRSAAFFGVREVLAPERRQALITGAAVSTAQGGFALLDLVAVVNLTRVLADLKERGYWIIGTAMDGEPLAKVAGEYQKVVLVLGGEESGLSRMARDACDRVVAIAGREGGLDSLNVSVAAGIVLHAFAAGAAGAGSSP
jgi:23S rRNA (guanosine2251-2'-O)-methyltransferase